MNGETVEGVKYTQQELDDLKALRALRWKMTPQTRSGNPARKAKAVVTLQAVEIEVAKIHRAAEARALVPFANGKMVVDS